MHARHVLLLSAFLLPLATHPVLAQQSAAKPLPDLHQLMREVQQHQKQVDEARENYTYTSFQTIEEIDASGQVTKTGSREYEIFYVNGHQIGRLVKKDGKPLSEEELRRQTLDVGQKVNDAVNTPAGHAPAGSGKAISIRHLIDLMDMRNPRRESYRGRAAIVFDVVGRKDADTHGIAEDASKKLKGTVWIDETDRVISRMEVTFIDNFHLGGGAMANIEKGSSIRLDQGLVNGEVWLPTAADVTMVVRVFMVKETRQHTVEHVSDYKRFHVDVEPGKDVKTILDKLP